ncbi:MAG: hypothetical protein ACYDEA_06860 [Candidatus Dormibacteria bacterium]
MLRPLAVGGIATILACAIGVQLGLLGSVLPVVALAVPFAVAVSMAAAVLLQRPALVTATAGLLLLDYGLVLTGRAGSGLAISTVGLVAGGTFLTLQLGWWAVELRTPAHEEAAVIWRDASWVAMAAVAVGLSAELAMLATRIAVGVGVIMVIVGVLSLAAIVAVAARLAARQASSTTWESITGRAHIELSAAVGPTVSSWSRVTRRIRNAVVGSPLAPSRVRSRRSMAATTGLSLCLLAVAAIVAVTALGSAAHPTSAVPGSGRSANITGVVELAILFTGAVLLNWLVRLLLNVSRPTVHGTRSDFLNGRQPESLSEVEVITHACRSVSADSPLDGELRRILMSLATQLGDHRLVVAWGGVGTVASASDFPNPETVWPLPSRAKSPRAATATGRIGSAVSVGTALAALESFRDA